MMIFEHSELSGTAFNNSLANQLYNPNKELKLY